MFKALIAYRVAQQFVPDFTLIEEALAKTPFLPIGATQETSIGWAPPRGEEHGALVEAADGQWVMKFQSESKTIPASVLNRKVQEKADAIEKEFGRKPGKKEKKDLKDEAKLDLLPVAFTKIAATWVWYDPQAGMLYIDCGSQSRADVVVSLLVESIKGFGVSLLDTQTSATAAMAHWLISQEPPAGFSIDRHVKLEAADESKARINYSRHALDIEEIKAHVEHGKLPTELAMTWDDRVSFILTDDLQIKKIEFTDGVLDNAGEKGGFDTDVAIATGELRKMIPDLIEALGGEGRREIGGQASEGGESDEGAAPARGKASLVEEVANHLKARGVTFTRNVGISSLGITAGGVTRTLVMTGSKQAPADSSPDSAPFDTE